MTDLEMTKLCAEAMGFHVCNGHFYEANGHVRQESYWPLTNDGQAMELVKTFRLWVDCDVKSWECIQPTRLKEPFVGEHADLNRAIVICVAKVQFDRTASETSTVATNE